MNTIVALSTPPLTAAIGVIRLSGNEAVEIVEKIFSKPLSDMQSHTVKIGNIVDSNGKTVDEVVVTVFRAPHSYTGENVVEISCHGSPYVLDRVVRLLIENGAAQARRGEFTKRAFLNGKLDLSQAEAVIDLIESKSERESDVSLSNMRGNVSAAVEAVRKDILDICAQILAFIDYPDDEIADVSPQTLEKSVNEAAERVLKLKKSYDAGRLIKDGVKTVICGKPNAGKSSLMNRLSGTEKSIVTPIAGTTRDIVEESVMLGGVKLSLFDTAGIHESGDEVEKIGVERAKKQLSEAELILFVCDAQTGMDEDDKKIIEEIKKTDAVKIAVVNKCDGKKSPSAPQCFDSCVFVSALTGEGFSTLSQAVVESFENINTNQNEIVMNPRQFECLCRAAECLLNAQKNIRLTPDAIITDLEGAVSALGEVTGKTTGEEIIENIFSRFCVGK